MPRIIALASSKGGCGATFVCASLWKALLLTGVVSCAVDMCFEECSLDYALSFHNDYVYTLADVIDGNAEIEDALCGENGFFVRCAYEEQNFPYEKAFELIKGIDAKYVLIDFDHTNSRTRQAILDNADEIIVVTEPSGIAIKHAEKLCTDLAFENTRIVINKIIPYLIRDEIHLTADEVLDTLGCHLLGLVPWDFAAEEIFKNGADTLEEHKNILSCFLNMADRLCGNDVPANDIEAFFKDPRIHKYLTKGRK